MSWRGQWVRWTKEITGPRDRLSLFCFGEKIGPLEDWERFGTKPLPHQQLGTVHRWWTLEIHWIVKMHKQKCGAQELERTEQSEGLESRRVRHHKAVLKSNYLRLDYPARPKRLSLFLQARLLLFEPQLHQPWQSKLTQWPVGKEELV